MEIAIEEPVINPLLEFFNQVRGVGDFDDAFSFLTPDEAKSHIGNNANREGEEFPVLRA